jgi:hypothetical protein
VASSSTGLALGGLHDARGCARRTAAFPSSRRCSRLEQADETLLDHILAGIGLAALYGARPADTRDDEADDDGEDD